MNFRRRVRRGMTMSELLIVVAVAAIVFMLAVPKIAVTRDGAGRRAARSQLVAAFAATRSAALQKGKQASLALTPSTAKVTVLTGLAGTEFTAWGPIEFTSTLGAKIEALDGAATTISYNARGMLTPTPAGTLKYELTVGAMKDTVCISTAGIIMPKGCKL
jgi:prepilin-type N-terminal cleavage/methylation domain-containing protein